LGILNFREIPRPTRNPKKGVESDDLDAFEKFAEEFFEKILKAEIITRMRRGADNLLDLKVRLEGKTALVSCKHQAHTDSAVSQETEASALAALITNDCDLFIGFYSTAPSGGLISLLEGFKQNEKFKFDYQIYKNTDIESCLLSSDNVLGWIFASRYFPISYANLFRRFVVPINHYKTSDLEQVGTGSWQLNGPFGGLHSGRIDKQAVIDQANDNLTNDLHRTFFNQALQDAINLFPAYFSYRQGADLSALTLADITPEWREPLVYDHAVGCNLPIIVCSLWSFWDHARSVDVYRAFSSSPADGSQRLPSAFFAEGILSIGATAAFSHGELRELFCRLVAFCPTSIKSYKGSDKTPFRLPDGSAVQWKFAAAEGLEFIEGRLRS